MEIIVAKKSFIIQAGKAQLVIYKEITFMNTVSDAGFLYMI
jgi:hypothetical protein